MMLEYIIISAALVSVICLVLRYKYRIVKNNAGNYKGQERQWRGILYKWVDITNFSYDYEEIEEAIDDYIDALMFKKTNHSNKHGEWRVVKWKKH